MNQRISDKQHKNAQRLLGMEGTTVEYIEVDLGSATSKSDRNNILKKYEQIEYAKQKNSSFVMLNVENRRIQAINKIEYTDELVRKHNVKTSKKRNAYGNK